MKSTVTEILEAPSRALDLPAPTDQLAATTLPPPTRSVPAPSSAPSPDAPRILTGPSAMFSTDSVALPDEYSIPSLPKVTPVFSSPAPSSSSGAGAGFDVSEFLAGSADRRTQAKKKPRGRILVRLLLLGALGGAGWLGVQHGPALYDEYVIGEDADDVDEVDAPLAFPQVTEVLAPIRTAEFELVGLSETPGATYRVTTDFETGVSHVEITRDSGPDLLVLTYANDAMIRRADETQWYLLERGQFPLDDNLDRDDWVMHLDELLPPSLRRQMTIEGSSESMVSGVATRHLTLSFAPGLLDAVRPVETPDPPFVDEIADPAQVAAAPGTDEPALVEIEIWVDREGLVRQITGAPQLGAQTITILRTSADAWIPDYPDPDSIAMLTASALLDLGI